MTNEEMLQEMREKMIRIELLLENQTKLDIQTQNAVNARLKKLEETNERLINELAELKPIVPRVGELENSMQWTWRVIVGGFITALIGAFFGLIKK